MKKILIAILFLSSASLLAQTPEKKKEDGKETTVADTSSKPGVKKSTGPKDTRMAITQKGVPSTKVKDNSASKTASTQPKEEKPSGQPK